MGMVLVPETLVASCNQLMHLIAQEDFIEIFGKYAC